MSENVLEFDVAVEKGVYRRFIVEAGQGIVKLVCDGKSIPHKNIKDLSTGQALLDAIADTSVEIFGENEIVVDKTALVDKINENADEFERVTNPVIEEEPVE